MRQHQERLEIATRGRGFVEVTADVQAIVGRSDVTTGMCFLYCRHTSCSLAIQENADPTARHDLERWLEKIAPEHAPEYTHTSEGPDDMPSHLRALVTRTCEPIPIANGRLATGPWQGIYLCEHRARPHDRTLVVHIQGE